jgi:hypothetical protein
VIVGETGRLLDRDRCNFPFREKKSNTRKYGNKRNEKNEAKMWLPNLKKDAARLELGSEWRVDVAAETETEPHFIALVVTVPV